MRLSSETAYAIDQLLASMPEPDDTTHYITKYPAGFEVMTFDDYLLYANNKIEYPTASAGRQLEIVAENNAVLTTYSLGDDSQYTLGQFVDTRPRIAAGHDIAAFDPKVMNHPWTELPTAQTDPIQYQTYWKSERALYQYYPKFNSAPVSIAPDGQKYIRYGNTIIQAYHDSQERWYAIDLEPVFAAYVADNRTAWAGYRHRDWNFYQEAKIRFDSSGDAYMLAVIQEVKPDGSGGAFDSILLHSGDKMKTWTAYGLEYPFSKFENAQVFNTEALARPPVITMHRYFTVASDPAGYVTIPVKNIDGTLTVPSASKFCESCVQTGVYHSGDANIAVTSNGTLFLAYSVLELERAPSIPGNHPANDNACLLPPQSGTQLKCRNGTPAYAVTFDIDEDGLLTDKSSPVFLGYGGRTIDDHNWPAIAIDSGGILHVILNGHHGPFTYTSSTDPESISAWSTPVYVGDGHSYATFDIDSDDRLYVMTRDSKTGYQFNLGLSTKEPGQGWVSHRYVVKRAKAYYDVWVHKSTIDPLTGHIYVTYYAQSQQIQMFRDEYDAMVYIWPERDKIMNPNGNKVPVGTAKTASKAYQIYNFTPTEMVTLVSTDGGATWRLSESTDY